MAPQFLSRKLCGSQSDLTVRDFLLLSPPTIWTVVASIFFCYYCVHPAIKPEQPKTIPMYWSLISGLPSTVVALHYYCFLRASVVKNGLSRASVRELTQAMRLVGLFCIFCFCILAIASALQFTECKTCKSDCYTENVVWFVASLFWMVLMACNSPTSKHYSKLIYTKETRNGALNSSVGTMFGRASLGEDPGFGGSISQPDQFVRAGVQPESVAVGETKGL